MAGQEGRIYISGQVRGAYQFLICDGNCGLMIFLLLVGSAAAKQRKQRERYS